MPIQSDYDIVSVHTSSCKTRNQCSKNNLREKNILDFNTRFNYDIHTHTHEYLLYVYSYPQDCIFWLRLTYYGNNEKQPGKMRSHFLLKNADFTVRLCRYTNDLYAGTYPRLEGNIGISHKYINVHDSGAELLKMCSCQIIIQRSESTYEVFT